MRRIPSIIPSSELPVRDWKRGGNSDSKISPSLVSLPSSVVKSVIIGTVSVVNILSLSIVVVGYIIFVVSVAAPSVVEGESVVGWIVGASEVDDLT